MLTIIYDNVVWNKALTPDWGFSCLVETPEQTLLFDAGANGRILLENMKTLKLAPEMVDTVFISHAHWDHTGGLDDFLRLNPVHVFIPASCPVPPHAAKVTRVGSGVKIGEGLYSTGELGGIEQSLVIEKDERAVVVAGCSHPGVDAILNAASGIGKVAMLIGGLHGFNDFHLIEDLDHICPAHCTQYIEEIKHRYPDKYIAAGAGRIIY
ncbi:MAG: MBL fold metallo-hydrolase [Desulfosarcina sp.]|nr:MBL fold metallo-hydrolase [Desulfosarcina sp.]MBC2743935.1 MBL fold metallo-hydrolase [Desulfosarcina sp.]MBC2766844.1 MBL fold metallo-hydrolase [Desulfosarcina sp.]